MYQIKWHCFCLCSNLPSQTPQRSQFIQFIRPDVTSLLWSCLCSNLPGKGGIHACNHLHKLGPVQMCWLGFFSLLLAKLQAESVLQCFGGCCCCCWVSEWVCVCMCGVFVCVCMCVYARVCMCACVCVSFVCSCSLKTIICFLFGFHANKKQERQNQEISQN